jgi:predicted DsbA family dithiol-disulfide isomerase
MTGIVIIYTDYVCPFCLLAEHVVAEAIQGLDVNIRWRPFELRPEPVPTLRVEDPYLPQIWQRSVYPMAKQLGVPMRLPAISPQPRTTLAFQVFAMAEEQQLGHAFSVGVMQAFFQQELDIGDVNVLADVAEDVGLNRQEVLAVLSDGRYLLQHQQALKVAVQHKVSSVPTIVVGDKAFVGVPAKDELRKCISEMIYKQTMEA